LHQIGGRSLIAHALTAARELNPRHVVAVVGHDRDRVTPQATAFDPDAEIAVQQSLDGTADAVRVGLDGLAKAAGAGSAAETGGTVVVTYGDVPLLTGELLRDFVAEHHNAQHPATIMTARIADPTGYGRVLRQADGSVQAVVEHKDATV